jgi:REP element-mobilizing transposase RayT
MALKSLPLEPGKYYHIYNRACGSDNLFCQSFNYDFFMEKFIERLGDILILYCYCLIPNHFHLLVKLRQIESCDNPAQFYSRRFSNFFNAYAQSFNKFYKRHGALFSQNFKRKEVEDISYRRMVVIYIHRNPLKHGLTDDLMKWQHSSFKEILSQNSEICRGEEVIKWFGSIDIFEFCHQLKTEITLGAF